MADYFLLAFWLFALAGLAISWWAGTQDDRRMIAAIILAIIASGTAYAVFPMRYALLCVVAIDIALLVVIGRYALTGEKYWPLWFAGFHAASLLFQIAAIFLPIEASIAAWRMGSFWSLPALLAMTIGLMIDRERLALGKHG